MSGLCVLLYSKEMIKIIPNDGSTVLLRVFLFELRLKVRFQFSNDVLCLVETYPKALEGKLW